MRLYTPPGGSLVNIGPVEIIVVLVIALLVFGPSRLPHMGRQLGRGIREFRNAAASARSELGLDEVLTEVNDVKKDVTAAMPVDEIKASVTDVKSGLGADELKTGIDDVRSGLKLDLTGGDARSAATVVKRQETPATADVPVAPQEADALKASNGVFDSLSAPEAPAPARETAGA
jgi:TatA/E family protein of Tat protein translocase